MQKILAIKSIVGFRENHNENTMAIFLLNYDKRLENHMKLI